jgi:tetratricopeptide (TPR) repeat protein
MHYSSSWPFTILLAWLLSTGLAGAQTPPTIQFFVPGQGLPSREVRFTLTDHNGAQQMFVTDRQGKLQLPSSLREGGYTVYVEANKRSHPAMTYRLALLHSLTLIPIFLQPLPSASEQPQGKLIEYDAPAPAEAQAAYEDGEKAASQNQYAAALNHLTRALQLYPQYLRALNSLGNLYQKLGLPEAAAAAFSYALSFNPRAHPPRLGLALLRHRQGRFDQSLELLRQILQEQPGLANLRIIYAEALSATQQWDEAEVQLREALKDAQLDAATRATAHVRLGIKLNRDGRTQAVAAEFAKAVELNPTWAQARLYLGAAYVQLNKPSEAEGELRKAYELGGKAMSNAQLLLGQLYQKQQKNELALRAYEQFLADAPTSTNAPQVREAVEKIKADLIIERK